MKRFILIAICMLCTIPAMAENKQETETSKTVFSAQLQKAPKQADQSQGAKMEKCLFCLQVQINGKIKTDNSAVQTQK